MKELKYISPTSLFDWEKDKEQFFLQRLSENRLPKFPQTQAMSIGSAFDARWKNYMAAQFLGSQFVEEGGQFHLETIFNEQVEEQHRPWAWNHSRMLFDHYTKSGALTDIMAELTGGSTWRFEFTLEGTIEYAGMVIPLLGKPDCYFKNREAMGILLDLKVNGYCSSKKAPAVPGYVRRRKSDGTVLGEHKDAMLVMHKGVLINANKPIDLINEQWATQLCIYAWLEGEEIGGDFVCGIEQLACGPPKSMASAENEVEIVSLRGRVTPSFQKTLALRLANMWQHVSQGHVFSDLTKEENDAKIRTLELQLADPKERFFLKG